MMQLRVSYIKENKDVKYNPTFDANGHNEYVEINGVKWATMNVGASGVTDSGCLYFQWGDTQGYTSGQTLGYTAEQVFDCSDYKFTTDGGKTFTKYNETGMTLALVDDAVHAAWKGSWRMPTIEEFQTLGDAIDKGTIIEQLTTKNGVYGLLLTEGDKELFFPACGNADGTSMGDLNFGGYYWSSSLYSSSVSHAYGLTFSNRGVHWQNNIARCVGFAVRGVLGEA